MPIQSVAVRTVDQLAMKGEKRKDAEKRYKADKDGFVEIVFCIDKGKAVARQVKTGIQSDELIEILDGLKEGDEVVTGSYRAISKDLENGAVDRPSAKEPEKDEGEAGIGAPHETAARRSTESFQIALQALRANKARGGADHARHHHRHRRGGDHHDRRERAAEQRSARASRRSARDVIYVSRMPWVVMNDFFLFRNRPGIDLREARALEERLRGRAHRQSHAWTAGTTSSTATETMEGVIDHRHHREAVACCPAPQPQIGRFLMPFDVRYKRTSA